MHWFLSLALHSEAPLEVVLKLFFISWRMFLESGNQTLPRAALALHPPGVAPRWLLMVLLGTGGMLAMLLHSGCCQVSSHMVSLQSGPVCGLALPDGHSGADCKQPVLLNPGCCCRSIYSIYLELLSALQLLLIQINVSFLSLYFLQCWHVAVLQSVGAVLSLELRNNVSPQFPGNSRPPPHCICYNHCASSVPQHFSCVGSLPSPVSLFHFLSSFHFCCLFFRFPLSYFCLKNIAAVCAYSIFQTLFQSY